jgi:hypothetical protein
VDRAIGGHDARVGLQKSAVGEVQGGAVHISDGPPGGLYRERPGRVVPDAFGVVGAVRAREA